jgi:hypothetical protein
MSVTSGAPVRLAVGAGSFDGAVIVRPPEWCESMLDRCDVATSIKRGVYAVWFDSIPTLVRYLDAADVDVSIPGHLRGDIIARLDSVGIEHDLYGQKKQ